MKLTRPLFNLATITVGGAVGALALYTLPAPPGIASRTAWICSLLSLMLSIASLQPSVWIGSSQINARPSWVAGSVVHHVALYLGVAAGLIQIILLTMRCVYLSIDLIHGFPWQGVRNYGFGPFGLWTIAALSVSCGFSFLGTRDGRLLTLQFWIMVVLGMWSCLLCDPFQATETGGFERTDATLILVECLACLILVAAVLVGWVTDSKFLQTAACQKNAGMHVCDSGGDLPAGFRPSVATLALVLNIAVLFQILVPAGQSTSILRMSGVRAGIAALIAAIGGLLLLRRTWGAHLADASLGLFALGLCGLATIAVPSGRISLDQQYPMIFNAIIVAYSFAAGIFAQLAWAWGRANFDPDSIRKRMIPHLNRFAFFSAATALLSGVMMCFWPGIPGISAMDHSIGRVIAGFSAFLFLLFVSLRSSRLLERLSLHFLTVAVAVSLVAFIVVRALPFASDPPH